MRVKKQFTRMMLKAYVEYIYISLILKEVWILNKLSVLKISFASSGVENVIYPVIIQDDNERVLIDCGYPGFLLRLQEVAANSGINLSQLTKVIITHHDFDHMGALAEFKKSYPHIMVLASEEEEGYVSGRKKSLRLQQAEAIYDSLPESQKQMAKQFTNMLEAVENVEVDQTVKDGDILSVCGGIKIIATPGHMPGHISIYHIPSKTLIAGDALVVENGSLAIANPQYTLDMAGAKGSIKKLLDYEIETIVCYHGGIVITGIREALQKISEE